MTTPTFTPATPHHAPALAVIHAAAFPPGAPAGASIGEAWGADAFALQLGLPGAFGFIDPAGAMILARVTVDEAEILTLAVAPAIRRHGHARALLAAAMRQAAAHGGESMVLEVAAPNQPAIALYQAAGFTQVGRRPRYYAGGVDALILRASLLPCG